MNDSRGNGKDEDENGQGDTVKRGRGEKRKAKDEEGTGRQHASEKYDSPFLPVLASPCPHDGIYHRSFVSKR